MDLLSDIILSITRDIELAKEQAEQISNKKKVGQGAQQMIKTSDFMRELKNQKFKQNITTDELYNCFKMIEDKFRSLDARLKRLQRIKEEQGITEKNDKDAIIILEAYKQEKRTKENKLREEKEKAEQERKIQKKLQAQQRAQHFGRKPMTKIIIDRHEKKEQSFVSDHEDSEEKYLRESFDLGNYSPIKSPGNKAQQSLNGQILTNV